jgi:hypothetical protein
MLRWTEPADILEDLRKKWDSGRVLREMIAPGDLYPIRIKLKGPGAGELGTRFSEAALWIERLKEKSKPRIGCGYDLEEGERNFRVTGRNTLPTHAVIETAGDALALLKKTKDAERFSSLAALFGEAFPEAREGLDAWFARVPHRALALYADRERILAVLRWFVQNPRSGLYLRQVDIPGIDTKFIEHGKGILAELLEIVWPSGAPGDTPVSAGDADAVPVADADAASVSALALVTVPVTNPVSARAAGAVNFEMRFGLRPKGKTVRFRFLDDALYLCGLSDIQTPPDAFGRLRPDVSRVFITENEINGLCFPDVPRALVIFGLGYGVDQLKGIEWLKDKAVYYWGDIDTHGFAILNRVRSFLPQTRSMLMDGETLLRGRALWAVEEKPFRGALEYLDAAESALYGRLRDGAYGKGVRLEQERIPFSEVVKAVNGLASCGSENFLGGL